MKNYPACRVKIYTFIYFIASLYTGLFFMLLLSSTDFKINFFEKFFQEYHQSVNQFGSRTGQTKHFLGPDQFRSRSGQTKYFLGPDQFGSRSGPTKRFVGPDQFGSKLFTKIISRQQNFSLADKEQDNAEGVNGVY